MMISIYIEGKKYTVEDSKNILETCLSLGFDIPYFCWHPALGSVGACRQCAVKQQHFGNAIKDTKSHLVMSCMTPVADGSSIIIFDDEVEEFRKSILELLMINHPHDCPICEEGGNCHLQDMTAMVGQTYRRYRFNKRTHYNQYLGPFIGHEMNRCITCYRCIRYYNDYAGGDDLGVFGVHDNIYFGRVQDGMLRSEFSGNLIEICPTGVFTDKTQSQNYTRKWDMIFAPSICQQCSVGCNIIVGERYGKLCRVENRYNGNINGYFLCDRGRFGCNYVNIDNRPKIPSNKQGDNWVVLNERQAIQEAANGLKYNCNRIIGIGSSRASMESNFSLLKLVGPDNFYNGINNLEQERLLLIIEILCNSGIQVPSLREVESYDTVLILGEDLTQTGARVALSIRQVVKGKARKDAGDQGIFDWQSAAIINSSQGIKNNILITGVDKTKLDDVAILTYYDSVQNQARFGFAIAHALDHTAPEVKDFDSKLNEKLDIVVQKLMEAHKPLIISGSNAGSKELIASAANIARALKNRGSEVGITFIVGEVNSIGLVMLGKKSLDAALVDICSTDTSSVGLIVLESDLYRHAQANQVDVALNKVNYLIVLDHQCTLIQKKANLVLPVSSFVESDGTVINYEGRAQRFFRLYKPQSYKKNTVILESWRWLYLIHDCYINYIRKKNLHIDQIIDAIIYYFPKLIGIKQASPDASFRIYGQKLARAPHRYSGRTAMYANVDVHEPYISQDDDTMFSFSMEGNHNVQSFHKQVAFAWAPGWNSPQAWNKFQDKVGENLYSGNPGIRVLHTDNGSTLNWFNMIPQSFKIMKNVDRWLIVPYWHLFGSEETSQRSKCIQDCMPNPYVMLNQLDALQLKIQKNMLLKFTCADQILCLPIKFSTNLPTGHIGLPLGFPDIPLFLSGMYAQDVQGVLL
ncbi:NADH-quinone oxidoreductase subunit NuoG [Candidatus Blochmanniella camponoti]|uniref:NADH-quinone oxidoreductase n=1 Tax=Candidatus Blochmanniella camponoti TaxID=108080 RepID=A0AAE9I9T3_9ENTR|nr:NADH-quinone oxidoreductase subunit NuoG [Candidatus Blochmannia herculeanus]URJ27678.1 NADH-quinone oxidoreductase subunit NuoG [Candidatus Blochmannia herculeanus]